jgi:hypothetical protein
VFVIILARHRRDLIAPAPLALGEA